LFEVIPKLSAWLVNVVRNLKIRNPAARFRPGTFKRKPDILYARFYNSPAMICLDDMSNGWDGEVAAISRRITDLYTASVIAAQISMPFETLGGCSF
jgi:hypothetical protein